MSTEHETLRLETLRANPAYLEAMQLTASPEYVQRVGDFVAKHGPLRSPTLAEIERQMREIVEEEKREALERSAVGEAEHVFELEELGGSIVGEAEAGEARSALVSALVAEAEADGEAARRLLVVRKACEEWWPEHWPVLEACLASSVSLSMKNVGVGIGLVLTGRSGEGKTTILEWLNRAKHSLFRTKITPASLMSGSSDQTKAQVEENAFVRKAKHKIVLISDLNPMIRRGGHDERIASGYKDFAVWLDGKGLCNEFGTHGTVGEMGDFSFVLLGAITPMDAPLWAELGTLGMRLLYVHVVGPSGRVSHLEFEEAKAALNKLCTEYLDWFFDAHPLRSVPWPKASPEQIERIQRAGKRIEISQQAKPGRRAGRRHVEHRLMIIASARALMYGRTSLDASDVACAEELAASSAWSRRGYILRAMDEGARSVKDIAVAAGLSFPRCQDVLTEMLRQGCVTKTLAELKSGRYDWFIKEEDECID